MSKVALYVPLEAKPGKEKEVAEFLKSALPLVDAEPGTVSWFAIQEGPSSFAIFDTFDDESGRNARFEGRGDERRLAIPRHAGNAHLGWIDARIRIGFEVVNEATDGPGPGAKRAPVLGSAWLALVGQADDAFA